MSLDSASTASSRQRANACGSGSAPITTPTPSPLPPRASDDAQRQCSQRPWGWASATCRASRRPPRQRTRPPRSAASGRTGRRHPRQLRAQRRALGVHPAEVAVSAARVEGGDELLRARRRAVVHHPTRRHDRVARRRRPRRPDGHRRRRRRLGARRRRPRWRSRSPPRGARSARPGPATRTPPATAPASGHRRRPGWCRRRSAATIGGMRGRNRERRHGSQHVIVTVEPDASAPPGS